MINDLMFIGVLVIIAAFGGKLLDYALGQPGREVNHMEGTGPTPSSIFFFWSLYLAEKRLGVVGRAYISMDEKLSVFLMARDSFFWEKAFGMCIYCTNVWLSWIICFCLAWSVPLTVLPVYYTFILVPISSHAILRHI